VPDDRVAALRRAFDETMKDPAFLADAEKRKMEIWPLSGEEMQKLVGRVIRSTPDVVAKAKSAIGF
jgi:hypothetical protein